MVANIIYMNKSENCLHVPTPECTVRIDPMRRFPDEAPVCGVNDSVGYQCHRLLKSNELSSKKKQKVF